MNKATATLTMIVAISLLCTAGSASAAYLFEDDMTSYPSGDVASFEANYDVVLIDGNGTSSILPYTNADGSRVNHAAGGGGRVSSTYKTTLGMDLSSAYTWGGSIFQMNAFDNAKKTARFGLTEAADSSNALDLELYYSGSGTTAEFRLFDRTGSNVTKILSYDVTVPTAASVTMDFAATIDGDSVKLFLDGSEVASATYNSYASVYSNFDNGVQVSMQHFLLDSGITGARTVAFSSLYYDAVPEPATMGLLSMGGLALLRRRRR